MALKVRASGATPPPEPRAEILGETKDLPVFPATGPESSWVMVVKMARD
jgi:hypothetical protein